MRELNVPLLRELADAVEASSTFTMAMIVDERDRPGDIAGHLRALAGIESVSLLELGERLGLAGDLAYELFMPMHEFADFAAYHGGKGWIAPEHAARVLRHLADTGEIDWSLGTPPVETRYAIEADGVRVGASPELPDAIDRGEAFNAEHGLRVEVIDTALPEDHPARVPWSSDMPGAAAGQRSLPGFRPPMRETRS